MSSTVFAAMLAFVAGLGRAAQIAVQGRLGDRVGTIEATATASFIGALIALVVLLAGRERIAVSWPRVLGLTFLCVGAVLTLKR